MSKKAFFASLALAASLSAAPVLTWVSPYSIYVDKTKLQNNAIANQLTHLGLQLWNPVNGGGLSYAPLNANGDLPTDADIQWYVNWAHGKGIKVWLTVYNNSETTATWNWSLVSGIVTNATARAAFVNAISAEITRLNLDGIDLDLEGLTTPTAAETAGYKSLVSELRAKLGSSKEINVDSFYDQYNAPNYTWWSGLWTAGANYITSMGYELVGLNSVSCEQGVSNCAYSAQFSRATAANAGKFIMGVPGNYDTWKNATIAQNLQAISANGSGVGIWEINNMTSSWLAGPSQLSTIKGSTGSSTATSSSSQSVSSSAALSSTTISSATQSSSGTALSSSATSTGNCTTWASNLYTYNGAWSGPSKVTTNGTTAWSCVAGQEAYCNSYSPTQNDWNQWQAAGNCTGTQSSSAALSSSSTKLSSVAIVSSSSNANTPVSLLTPLALMSSQGTSLQIQGEGLVQLQLRDLQGHVVWQDQKLISGMGKVEMNRQAQGHYVLEMRLGNQVQHIQMILR